MQELYSENVRVLGGGLRVRSLSHVSITIFWGILFVIPRNRASLCGASLPLHGDSFHACQRYACQTVFFTWHRPKVKKRLQYTDVRRQPARGALFLLSLLSSVVCELFMFSVRWGVDQTSGVPFVQAVAIWIFTQTGFL